MEDLVMKSQLNMIKISLILLITVFFLLMLVACKNKENEKVQYCVAEETDPVTNEVTKTEWAIGENCPAGGIVFYDKGDDSDSWRYLSVSPVTNEFTAMYSEDWYGLGYIEDEIGTGKRNTEIIVEHFNQTEEQNTAAQLCVALNIGGFSDWFLPSINELNQMFINLYEKGLGDFSEEAYWSSSQDNWKYSKMQYFAKDGRDKYAGNLKNTPAKVRAIRAF